MRQIDPKTWNRRETAAFFGALDFPFYNMSWRADVTNLHRAAKESGQPFYCSMIYEVMHALNGVDAFLYKLRGESVVRHDALSPSFTAPAADERFKIVSMDWDGRETRAAFCARAKALADAQTALFPTGEQEQRDDWVYISCVPWVDFLTVTNEMNIDRDDSVPRVSWGRFVPEGDRLRLTVALQVNHRLIDGVHIGKFADLLQSRLDEA